MPTWDAQQYLRFNDQRTRPCRELAGRIGVASPKRVIDLGCGPGNSTEVLAERWPGAELMGVDSSVEMIAAARKGKSGGDWRVGDIAGWAGEQGEKYDVVFSNAAMQWVGGHAEVLPKLLERVASGGALAIQMPHNYDCPAHRLMREIAGSNEWRGKFPDGGVREWHVEEAHAYYDILGPVAASVDIWETEYLQVMADAMAIVDWYKGTGLRPFLDALGSDALREEFLGEYHRGIEREYPKRADGKVTFPFRRIFMIGYQK